RWRNLGIGEAPKCKRRSFAVYWEHPHPEALYRFRVKDFGPRVVAMDSHGNSLYAKVKEEVQKRLPGIYGKLGIQAVQSEHEKNPLFCSVSLSTIYQLSCLCRRDSMKGDAMRERESNQAGV
ncbi:MAG: hypothetical protein Q7U75_04275, partial [Desulfobacterales bacterium]|nr:hypothetical protein [Desulfobacterales bacterium]